MENESSIKEIIQNSLEQVRTIVDADTVVGKQIVTPSGTIIIPISKVSMGFATGGLDYNGKNEPSDKAQNFGAGGGTGLTINPIGFLVVAPNGSVDMINVGMKNPSDPIEQVADLLERSPEIIAKIKSLFDKAPDAQ